jgi:hypothetical protein
MIERLKKPGGQLGTLSVISTFALALIGTAGVVGLVVSLVTGADVIWFESHTDKIVGIVFFALAMMGGVGFIVMDRTPLLGASLAVVGGIAFAVVMFSSVVTVVVGLGAAVVAALRAWALHHEGSPERSAP